MNYDALMLGGGVMGCATAYHLLKNDPTLRVAIVEKDPSYAQSSSVLSDGNLRVQFNIKENVQISLYGLQVLARFAEEFAVDGHAPQIDFRRQGDLFLVNPADEAGAREGMALQQELGAQVEWLHAGEVTRRYPFLDETQFAGGTLSHGDGTMDTEGVLQAYKNKAVALGAEYIAAEVVEVRVSDRQVTGVRLHDGRTLHSAHVVNSSGAWGTEVARGLGIALPIDPVKRHVFLLETQVSPAGAVPLIVLPSGLYLIHEHGNRFLCGKSFDDDPVGYDFAFQRQLFIDRLWEELVQYAPRFDQLKVVGGWAGLYAVNRFDGNAFIGEWPELRGFWLVNGFSGHGFQQCHAVGRYLAERILGQEPSLDLSIFSPQRLLENAPVYENAHKLV